MIVTEIHSRGLSRQLIDLVSSKSDLAFQKESLYREKITSDKSARRYLDFIKEIFKPILINKSSFNIKSNHIKNTTIAFNLLQKNQWNKDAREDLINITDTDTEDCYSLNSVICRIKKKEYPLQYYLQPINCVISIHALSRIFYRLNIDSNDNFEVLNELKFCGMFANFWNYYTSDWNDLDFIQKLTFTIPTFNGMFLCKRVKSKVSGSIILVRTFIADDQMRDDQKRLKEKLLHLAISLYPTTLHYPLHRIPEFREVATLASNSLYSYFETMIDELADSMITFEQFGKDRDFEVYKLKQRIQKDFNRDFKNY